MKRTTGALLPALLLALALVATASAHGARITYTLETTVTIQATYDTGEAMAGAQVVVYAPDDPATPWRTGTCDEEGRFTFAPDPERPGTWDVQVRQAGHGDIVHIPVGGGVVTAGMSPLQMAVTGGAVLWGLVGTALFFMRRPRQPEEG